MRLSDKGSEVQGSGFKVAVDANQSILVQIRKNKDTLNGER